MNSNNLSKTLLVGTVAVFLVFCAIGCGDNDNRTPTQAEIKTASANRLKYINGLNVPEDSKKAIASHLGGPPYTSPGQEAAMAALAARNKTLPPGVRTH